MRVASLALAASCSSAAVPPAGSSPPSPSPPSKACAAPEHRQFDFWLGTWDVTIQARSAPGGPMGTARGTNRIASILGGCAIQESFTADGPQTPWAGHSYSSYQPVAGKWRQTWVDDQGSYIALTGGIENGVMTLYGEPREKDGQTIQMRMVFLEVAASSLRWEWQRTVDAWQTPEVMMRIDYARAKPGP